jgi:hypothetical protein
MEKAQDHRWKPDWKQVVPSVLIHLHRVNSISQRRCDLFLLIHRDAIEKW